MTGRKRKELKILTEVYDNEAYDDIINKCLNLLENTNMTTYKKKNFLQWDIENELK